LPSARPPPFRQTITSIVAASVAWCCALLTLGILLTPLLLALLMVLFDTTAKGFMELLAWLLDRLETYLLPQAGGLPPYQSLDLLLRPLVLGTLLPGLPCLAGLLLVLRRPAFGRHWLLAALAWGLSAALGGITIALLLLPACLAALFLGLGQDAGRRRGAGW